MIHSKLTPSKFNIPDNEFTWREFAKMNPQLKTYTKIRNSLLQLEVMGHIAVYGYGSHNVSIYKRINSNPAKSRSDTVSATGMSDSSEFASNAVLPPEKQRSKLNKSETLSLMCEELYKRLPDKPFTLKELSKEFGIEYSVNNVANIRTRINKLIDEEKVIKLKVASQSHEVTYCKAETAADFKTQLISPSKCVRCGSPTHDGKKLCVDCNSSLSKTETILQANHDLETINSGIANDIKCILSILQELPSISNKLISAIEYPSNFSDSSGNPDLSKLCFELNKIDESNSKRANECIKIMLKQEDKIDTMKFGLLTIVDIQKEMLEHQKHHTKLMSEMCCFFEQIKDATLKRNKAEV